MTEQFAGMEDEQVTEINEVIDRWLDASEKKKKIKLQLDTSRDTFCRLMAEHSLSAYRYNKLNQVFTIHNGVPQIKAKTDVRTKGNE